MLPLATALHIRWRKKKAQHSCVMLPSGGEFAAGQGCMNNGTHAYLMHGKEVVEDTL